MNVLPGPLPDGYRSGGVEGLGYPLQWSNPFGVFMFKFLPTFRSKVSCFSLSHNTTCYGSHRVAEADLEYLDFLDDKIASRTGAGRPPMTDVGTETTFRKVWRRILFCTLKIENVWIFWPTSESQITVSGLDRFKSTRTLLPRRFEYTTSSSVGR